jgi:hypothetical protein
MERIAVDEAAAPELHVWMSLLRLLLQVHPRVGADAYARVIGQPRRSDLAPGWNRVHRAAGSGKPPAYIWIAPGGGEGRTTADRPEVPESDIHEVHEDDLPALEQTAAWRMLGELNDRLQDRPKLAHVTGRHLETLAGAAAAPLRGPDPSVDARIGRIFDEIRRSLQRPHPSLTAFTAPLERIVDEYLDLRLTRRHASNILGAVFARLALTSPGPDPGAGIGAFIGQVDHLINLTSQIQDERQQYDLGGFYRLTCLGLLWAETAQLMCMQIAARAPRELARTLEAKARYVEELAVHELDPSLYHPFLLVPIGALALGASATRGLISKAGIYQGAGVEGKAPLVPGSIWPAMQRHSQAAGAHPVPWENYTRILSDPLAQLLQVGLAGASRTTAAADSGNAGRTD